MADNKDELVQKAKLAEQVLYFELTLLKGDFYGLLDQW